MTLAIIISVILMILRVCEVINLGWVGILMPIFIVLGIYALIILFALIVIIIVLIKEL